jgi:hypothetical protein
MIYYVRKSGNDSNNGTSPATAWLTIAKALGASGMGSGDTLYIGAGVYREQFTVTMPDPTTMTYIIGDIDGSQTGDLGEVQITCWTDDVTTPAAGATISLNGRDNITFRNIVFVAGQTYWLNMNSASTNIVFEDCIGLGHSINCVLTADPAVSGITFRRCSFFSGQHNGMNISCTLSNIADFDAKVLIEDCFFVGGGDRAIAMITNGTGTGLAGNVIIRRNTFIGYTNSIRFASASYSNTLPSYAYGNITCGINGIFATTLGQVIEDYNLILSGVPRTNTDIGANSKTFTNQATLIEIGQSRMIYGVAAPLLGPAMNSPILGFGNHVSHLGTVDNLNRPRPAGSGNRLPSGNTNQAVGAFERHDTAVFATDQFDVSPSIVLVGPADHDIQVLVPAQATSLSVKVRYDTNHGTGSKPQAMLLANAELGIAAQTVTATAGVDTWQTLTFSSFTPSNKGVVTLRLISRAAAGNGKAWFDSVAVA